MGSMLCDSRVGVDRSGKLRVNGGSRIIAANVDQRQSQFSQQRPSTSLHRVQPWYFTVLPICMNLNPWQ